MDSLATTDRSSTATRTTPGRTRGWAPALVAALVSAGGLWVLELLADVAPFAGLRDDYQRDTGGLWAGLIGGRVTYFGSDNGALVDSSDHIVRVVLTTVAVIVVAYVVTWLATVGLRARAVLPLFFATWLAAVLAGVGGLVVAYADARVTSDGGDSLGRVLGPIIDVGGSYGLLYGWIPALLAALVWAALPARRTTEVIPEDGRAAGRHSDSGDTVALRSLIDDGRRSE